MANANISIGQEEFSCPICLDLLKDPVTINCGHSFCKVCLNNHWDQEDERRLYSCPHCRKTFTPRPDLHRNNMLAEVVEKLKKKTEGQIAQLYAGPGDVECDFCAERKHKATQSCLMCLASFCENHLKPHFQSSAFKKHTLIKASAKLQEKICSEHDRLIEIYCRTDQICICVLCMMNNHRGHDTVTVAAERAEIQKKFQQRIQEKQKKVQELKQAVNTIKLSAQTAVEDSEIIFTELISLLEKKRSEVIELIRAHEKAELSPTERLLEEKEQEIADLQMRLAELEQLSYTQDNIYFIQDLSSGLESLQDGRPNLAPSHIIVPPEILFDGVRNSLTDLKNQVEEFCEKEFNKISLPAFCYLTLDPNTAHHFLNLSEKNKVVMQSRVVESHSDPPERFDIMWQVLCKESVCGCCYWEVEWSGVVEISVSYKDISRKGNGNECVFGRNNQSWSLHCSSLSLSFWHNNIETDLRAPSSSRIGVYVDHSAGTLSFYSVSDTMKLLHRVHTTFTQPLYAGFRLYSLVGSAVKLCEPIYYA